jgi:hypothetical protein
MSTLDSRIWPDKYPQERITVEFDFGRDLSPGDPISTVQLALTTVLGTDASPQSMLFGAAQIKGSRVFQQLQGGLAGCSYRVQAQATTQNNNILVLARVLPVVEL